LPEVLFIPLGFSPHSVATILVAYYNLEKQKNNIEVLRENIIYFNQEKNLLGLKPLLSAANQYNPPSFRK
jgi:hypothetical protein